MTSSATIIFPGQGSQYVGMGSRLQSQNKDGTSLMGRADEALGFPLSEIMLNDPESELTLTQNTQPAILTHSIMLYQHVKRFLQEKNITIDRVLGHSVGEYSALVAADAISFEDAVKAVHMRGKFMQEAVPVGVGKMIAIMKVPEEVVERACREVSTEDSQVMPANFNCPGQIVVSGHADACTRAVEWLKDNLETPHRTTPLDVSAPFHSSLMNPAAERLEQTLKDIEFSSNSTPYIANIDANEYPHGTSADTIKKNLVRQVAGTVLWSQSISKLPDQTICIECGPGRVLMGLIRKINKNIKVVSLDKDNALEELRRLYQ